MALNLPNKVLGTLFDAALLMKSRSAAMRGRFCDTGYGHSLHWFINELKKSIKANKIISFLAVK